MEEGEQRGFGEKQIRTAASKLNVVMEKEKSFKGAWHWCLPM
jgi:hypothetical protein